MSPLQTTLLAALGAGLVLGGLVWVIVNTVRNSDDPGRLIAKWVVTLVLLVVLGVFAKRALGDSSSGGFFSDAGMAFIIASTLAVFGLLLGWLWGTNLGELIARPFERLYLGGGASAPQPFYAIAEAKRKRGEYAAAMAEIEAQLQVFPKDFKGHLLLAEIKAENLLDLEGAQRVIERFLAQSGHAPGHVAYALNRLADWHLKLAQDPGTARAILERIVTLLPDTEAAQVARQRLAHLPTREYLIETRERPPVRLEHHEDNIGLRHDFTGWKPPPENHAATAAPLVRHLQQFPYDNEAREKLAMIYADHYQRLDLAADQLNELTKQANQPAHEVVRWLNLLADFQVRLAGDVAAGRATLQRIIDRYPNSAAAESARRRMVYLPTELVARKPARVVQLGACQQNLGLKRDPRGASE